MSSNNNTFPSSAVETSVGNIQVADKSYDIQGNVVDSTKDTPIDVNALVDSETLPKQPPSTGFEIKLETNGGSNDRTDTVVQKNPDQSFVKKDNET